MYKLPYFTEQDQQKVIAFMKEYNFAVINGIGERYPVASHIPLEITGTDKEIILTGHLMKNTDHHKAFMKNENVLVVFNGPHTHISASWYPKKNIASTWNYMTVHAKGRITFLDEKATYNAVKNITEKYETPESPAAFDKIPDEYIQQLLKAIVAFEIKVESIDNVFKLSQNHDAITRKCIVDNLLQKQDDGARLIAKEMMLRTTEK